MTVLFSALPNAFCHTLHIKALWWVEVWMEGGEERRGCGGMKTEQRHIQALKGLRPVFKPEAGLLQ